MRGRKPTPDYMKLVHGNPGHRPIAGDGPKPEPKAMAAPAWLPEAARTEWTRIMPELVRWGLFTRLDAGALACYCIAFAQVRRAQKTLKGKQLTYETVGRAGKMLRSRPELAQMHEAMRQLSRFAAEFGLSPAARVRLRGTAQGELFPGDPVGDAKTGTDPWDAI